MTKLNIAAFKALVQRSRSKSALLANPVKDKIATLASAWAITEESINIDDHLNDFFNVTGSGVFSSDELSLDRDEKAEKNSKVVINWLIKLVNDL